MYSYHTVHTEQLEIKHKYYQSIYPAPLLPNSNLCIIFTITEGLNPQDLYSATQRGADARIIQYYIEE